MRPLIAVLALTLLAAPVLSGCVGGQEGEEAGPTNTSEDNDTGNDTGDDGTSGNESGNESGNFSGNESGNESGFGDDNETGNESASWTYDNRSGSVSSTDPILLTGSEEEAFEVENGTLELALNLSAEDDLDVCIKEPGAEECTEEASTEDGNLSWNTTQPAGGEWTVELSHSGVLSSVDYELVIGQLIPANFESSSGNETAGNDSGNDTRIP